jgi:ribosomal-protein-alanine N-acetyltransferase
VPAARKKYTAAEKLYWGVQLRIVRFRLAGLPRLMRIERASFGPDAYQKSLFRELYRECSQLFFAARVRAELVGYIVGCVEDDRAEVVSLAVAPEWRRAGAGRALMDRLLAEVKRRGARTVELMVRTDNVPGIRFYRSFAFRRVKTAPRYYEDGADGYVMRRRI